MRINRKCPVCGMVAALARHANIGPKNRVLLLLACQSCLHEWEVEEEISVGGEEGRKPIRD